eukprot:scaffold4518_cov410-Prasinococcus_capsulatus_cf.AAC.5
MSCKDGFLQMRAGEDRLRSMQETVADFHRSTLVAEWEAKTNARIDQSAAKVLRYQAFETSRSFSDKPWAKTFWAGTHPTSGTSCGGGLTTSPREAETPLRGRGKTAARGERYIAWKPILLLP